MRRGEEDREDTMKGRWGGGEEDRENTIKGRRGGGEERRIERTL